ncbi:Congested-like trachea protein [Gryllus bimaculatus]|nr:Congested-like trachea protein [Gryllus bimaculatus]
MRVREADVWWNVKVVVGHPFDINKVRVQTMPKHAARRKTTLTPELWSARRKTLAADRIQRTIQRYGGAGCDSGNDISIDFCLGHWAKKQNPKHQHAHVNLKYTGLALSGLLHDIQRLEKGPPKYKRPMDLLIKAVREGVIEGCTKNRSATCCEIFIDRMYFMTYGPRKEVHLQSDSRGPQRVHTIWPAAGRRGVLEAVGIPRRV